MQKASFHTHSTHTHRLLSRGLQKHCKGKARPYTKIASPIPKMQLLLRGDLLTSESDSYGSLAGRWKTHTKGYFSSNMPLFMQDVVVGSLSIKRKCSREAETPILLRGGQVSRAPSPASPQLPPAGAAQPDHRCKGAGAAPTPCRTSKGCHTICRTSWWSQQSRRLPSPFFSYAFSSSLLVFPFSKTYSPRLPSLPPCSLAPHSAPTLCDTQATWFPPSLLTAPNWFSSDPSRASSLLCFKEQPAH